jgi:hypothetical protein
MIANEKVLICNTLNRFSFAGSFAEIQTSASGTNAFICGFLCRFSCLCKHIAKNLNLNTNHLQKFCLQTRLQES